jgi:hypothetical protein
MHGEDLDLEGREAASMADGGKVARFTEVHEVDRDGGFSGVGSFRAEAPVSNCCYCIASQRRVGQPGGGGAWLNLPIDRNKYCV